MSKNNKITIQENENGKKEAKNQDYFASWNSCGGNQKKHREERRTRLKPYYSKFSLYDMKGEPLIERDFEG